MSVIKTITSQTVVTGEAQTELQKVADISNASGANTKIGVTLGGATTSGVTWTSEYYRLDGSTAVVKLTATGTASAPIAVTVATLTAVLGFAAALSKPIPTDVGTAPAELTVGTTGITQLVAASATVFNTVSATYVLSGTPA